jgi:RNA polymerase sigma-70 factor (ECF subfamily)
MIDEAYKRFYKLIRTLIFKRVHNLELAEELTQEVFLKAHQFRVLYDPAKASLLTWLKAIADNTVKNHKRTKKHNQNMVSDRGLVSSSPNPETTLLHKEAGFRLLHRFHLLALPQRRVLWLQAINNMSEKTISQLTGYSVNSVKQRLYRARRSLITKI